MKKTISKLSPARKTKKKQIPKIKNLEPVSIKITELKESDKAEINQIKKAYGFHPNFDLVESLSHIPTKKILAEYYRQKSSKKEMNNTLKILKQQMTAANHILSLMIKSLSNNGTNELTSLLDILNTIGKNNRDLIAKNMTGGYKTLNQIRESLELLGNKNLLTILSSNIQYAISSIEEIQKNQQKPMVGRREGNLPLKDTILNLLPIYKQGTTQEKVTCYFHPLDRCWRGDFHAFLLEILPYLGFNIVNPEILGKCARNMIDLDNQG